MASAIRGAQPSSLTAEGALGSRSKRREEENRLWSQVQPWDYVVSAQPQDSQELAMGSSELHRKAEYAEIKQPAANVCSPPSLLQNERRHTLPRLGQPQHEQRGEGVHHDINSSTEQRVPSRAMPHCLRRVFIPRTTTWTSCAHRAAAEGLHSYSSKACSHYASFRAKPEKKKKPQQTGYFRGVT